MNQQLKSAFRYWMKRRKSAVEAIELARRDIAENKSRYPVDVTPFKGNPYFAAYGSRKLLWIENPLSFGLRFVGYADEIANGIEHKGWYIDNYFSEAVRGVVYQIPGKNGRARFVAAIEDPHNGSADDNGPVCLDMSTIHVGDILDVWSTTRDDSGAVDAAYAADSLAESMAEAERDYQRAWEAGAVYQETCEEIEQQRTRIRMLLEDRKRAMLLGDPEKFPTLCSVIKERVSESLTLIAKLRDKRDRLKAGDYSEKDYYLGFSLYDESQVSAFNDGAGAEVLKPRGRTIRTSSGVLTL